MNDVAYIGEICRFYVMLVLLAAAAGKLRNIRAFQNALEALTGVSSKWSRGATLYLITAEGLVGLLLLFGGEAARIGMMAAAALFLVFLSVISLALTRRSTVACNCFGSSLHTVSGIDLLRSIGLLTACAIYLGQFGDMNDIAFIDLIAIFGVAMIAALLSIHMQDIKSLLHRRQIIE
ncbi:MauE/DoxX family redox-associated membrane protein [Brevundimonas sp.]|uniref:MauE/DoxX family redox-associated membrane protein n=1 Tax=Brevundimonas sp. TaxID=1871086 RepID=UPI002897908D|nr:MauE/DoxX family redox-associated membrane protein [Brevundimonas sp.]